MFHNIGQHYQVMTDHSKVTKMHFWMIQSAKKWCSELSLFDQHDIAYYDETKCFPRLGNTARSWRIIQKSWKSIFVKWGWLDLSEIAYYSGSQNVHSLSSQVQKSSACFFIFIHWLLSWICYLLDTVLIFKVPQLVVVVGQLVDYLWRL